MIELTSFELPLPDLLLSFSRTAYVKGAQPQGTQARDREGPGVAARFNKEPKSQAAHSNEAGWKQVWEIRISSGSAQQAI